jgi:hypothetical protein
MRVPTSSNPAARPHQAARMSTFHAPVRRGATDGAEPGEVAFRSARVAVLIPFLFTFILLLGEIERKCNPHPNRLVAGFSSNRIKPSLVAGLNRGHARLPFDGGVNLDSGPSTSGRIDRLGVGESLHDDYKGKTTGIPNPFDSTIQNIAKQGADRNNARLSHGIFGAFVGLLSGLTGGLDRRSATRAVSAGRVGIAKGRIEISKDFR